MTFEHPYIIHCIVYNSSATLRALVHHSLESKFLPVKQCTVLKLKGGIRESMYPHEHFLVALIPVALYTLLWHQQLPSKTVVCAVFAGSLFPDMVDKPLAHYLHIIPNGRVFIHSLPFAIPLSAIVLWYGWKTDRFTVAGAFTAGVLFHPFGDFYQTLLRGTVPSQMLWPLVPTHSASYVPVWTVPWSAFSALALASLFVVLARDIQLQIQKQKQRTSINTRSA